MSTGCHREAIERSKGKASRRGCFGGRAYLFVMHQVCTLDGLVSKRQISLARERRGCLGLECGSLPGRWEGWEELGWRQAWVGRLKTERELVRKDDMGTTGIVKCTRKASTYPVLFGNSSMHEGTWPPG